MLSQEYVEEGLVYDPAVKGFDSNFWKGDTANLLADTVRNAVKIGDTALVGGASSYSQYILGEFEFDMNVDSLSPDSNDSEKYFGLRNLGDSDQRGAAYFSLSYDTTAGDSSTSTRPFSIVAYDKFGNRARKFIDWDTDWGGGGRTAKFKIVWEPDGYTFLVNDSVVGTISTINDTNGGSFGEVNNDIPQALRISNRSLDTTDTASTCLKLLIIKNARRVI